MIFILYSILNIPWTWGVSCVGPLWKCYCEHSHICLWETCTHSSRLCTWEWSYGGRGCGTFPSLVDETLSKAVVPVSLPRSSLVTKLCPASQSLLKSLQVPPPHPACLPQGMGLIHYFLVSPLTTSGGRFICILSIFGNCLYLEGGSAWSIPPLWETEHLFMETFIVCLLCTDTPGCKGIFLSLKRVILTVIGDGLHHPEWLLIGTTWDFLKPCVWTQGSGCVRQRKIGGTSIKICWATWPGNFT